MKVKNQGWLKINKFEHLTLLNLFLKVPKIAKECVAGKYQISRKKILWMGFTLKTVVKIHFFNNPVADNLEIAHKCLFMSIIVWKVPIHHKIV